MPFPKEIIYEVIRAVLEIIALFAGASFGAYYLDARAKKRQLKRHIYTKFNYILDHLQKIMASSDEKIKNSLAIESWKNELTHFHSKLVSNEQPLYYVYYDINYLEIEEIIEQIMHDNYSEARAKMQKLKKDVKN